MARPLILSLDGQEFPVNLTRIDREKIYGSVEIEAFDEKGKPASIRVLAADGKTLIDKGGTALATVNEDGTSVSRSVLTAVDSDGDPIEPVPSSFDRTNVLREARAEEYLSQLVKSVYFLSGADDTPLDLLSGHLSDGKIYKFDFSYRGGLEYDSAFIVGGSGGTFMVVGKQGALRFVRLNQAAVLDTVEEQEISADEIDFEFL